MLVANGTSAVRNAWRMSTRARVKPLARAVRTCSIESESITLART